jgi:hypothetical protein
MGRWRAVLTAAVLALAGLLALAGSATASHVRPRGATPVHVPLVPSYYTCTAPNRTHGAPLAYSSCAPPVPTTNHYLTVGTPDANGVGANSVGSFLVQALTADIRFTLDVTDVRCGPATAAAVCQSANAADGPDYSGDVQASFVFRSTDHSNGPNGDEAATLEDLPFPVNGHCMSTASTTIGGECSVVTTANAFAPGAVVAGKRAIWELGQVLLFDAGADGDLQHGEGAVTIFMRQGVFVP